MLINYLKLALRTFYKNKAFSFINIVGLAIGLAASFVILLYVVNETSFDKYNKKLDDIYILTNTLKDFNTTMPTSPYLLAPSLKEQYPQIREIARWTSFRTSVKYKEKVFSKVRCVYSEPAIFNIFTLPVEKGTIAELSTTKNSVIISSETAKIYFGNTDPVGQILTLQNPGGTYEVKIAGIMKNIPETSTFRADIIAPLKLLEPALDKNWSNVQKNPLHDRYLSIINAYIMLKPETDVNNINRLLRKYSENYSDKDWKVLFQLFPVKDIYFHSAHIVNNRFPTGDLSNVYIYSVIGFLILLIACINIIILNTGRASTRAKEIGVRQVVGAGRSNIVRQVLVESSLNAFLSLPMALILVEIFLPRLSGLLGKELPADYFHNWQFTLMFLTVTLLVGIISGSYISFYMSKLRPGDIIRKNFNSGSKKIFFRKVMVVSQMIIFIGLIIAFVTINKQMNYFHNKDFGFNKENLVVFYNEYDNPDLGQKFDTFKNELMVNHNITGVTAGQGVPGTEGRVRYLLPNKLNPSKKILVEALGVDKDFFEVMGMKIIHGKSFADLSVGELENSYILNETAVRKLSIKNPIGEFIGKKKIIGVVKDFNMHSLREPIQPIVAHENTRYLNEIVIRVLPAKLSQTIKFIQATSKKFNKGRVMEYDFFDERIDDLYGSEQKFNEMIGFFTGLAIFIACLGLFGMSLFVSQQRIKEIGIRKVMGASTGNIFYMLTKEFMVLTVISTVITIPVIIYFMNMWLQNFAYKVSLDAWIFIVSAIAGLLITVLTVGVQAVKAATSNPVETLRSE